MVLEALRDSFFISNHSNGQRITTKDEDKIQTTKKNCAQKTYLHGQARTQAVQNIDDARAVCSCNPSNKDWELKQDLNTYKNSSTVQSKYLAQERENLSKFTQPFVTTESCLSVAIE